MKLTRKSLYLDLNQGKTANGCAFGYVMSTTDTYRGWFFTWPRDVTGIRTAEEREQVLDSLELDAEHVYDPEVPYRWARQILARELRKYDCRKKAA